MRAWLLDRIGSIQHLRLGEAPDPVPGEGEVLMRVEYAGLNPADRYLAEGLYPAKPALPHILGRDGCGLVDGQRMVILRGEAGVTRPGTFAGLAAVPADCLAPAPEGWTAEQCGGAPLVYLTAYQALTMWGELKDAAVLVTGASGGVGTACVHLARALGHQVIALSRSAEKGRRLREEGAGLVLDPSERGWPGRIREFLGGRKVDLAVDTIGGELFPRVIESLADQGRVSCVGRLAGPVPSFNTATLFFKRLRIGGVSVGAYRPPEARADFAQVLRLLGNTGKTPLVDSVWEFPRLPEAFARLAQGPLGKVVLKVS
ncbi:MAG: zinc-binding alcohol dehydrogenase family protein [Elusimicrobia bacterium]|nr:zinc-binding alcohol dehydrogenase family protein [Elusimicrobiota bacterium]